MTALSSQHIGHDNSGKINRMHDYTWLFFKIEMT